MKKVVMLSFLTVLLFFCGKNKSLNDEFPLVSSTVFIDTSYVEKESDASLLLRYWVYCYSDKDSVTFYVDRGSIYDYDNSLLDRRDLDAISGENHMWLFSYRINGDYSHIRFTDSLLIEVDYRIIKLIGVSDTGFVYEVLRNSTASQWSPVI